MARLKSTLYSNPQLILNLKARFFVFLVGPPAHFLQVKIDEQGIRLFTHRPTYREIMATDIRIKTTDQREYIIRLRVLLEVTTNGEEVTVEPERWDEIIVKTEALSYEENKDN